MMDIFAHTFLLEGQRGQDCCVWRWDWKGWVVCKGKWRKVNFFFF